MSRRKKRKTRSFEYVGLIIFGVFSVFLSFALVEIVSGFFGLSAPDAEAVDTEASVFKESHKHPWSIPTITEPVFIDSDDGGDIYVRSEVGVSFEFGDELYFVPLRSLNFYPIVRVMDSDRGFVSVTYSPALGVSQVFQHPSGFDELFVSPVIVGGVQTLQSDDGKRLWLQPSGESLTGAEDLVVVDSQIVSYGEVLDSSRFILALSFDSGFRLFPYRADLYEKYRGARYSQVVGVDDDRLNNRELVFVVVVDGGARAYPLSLFEKVDRVIDDVGGGEVVLRPVLGRGGDVLDVNVEGVDGVSFILRWESVVELYPEVDIYQTSS